MSKDTQRVIAVGAAAVALLALLVNEVIDHAIDEPPDFVRFLVLGALNLGLAVAIFGLLVPNAESSKAEENRPAQFGFGLSLAAIVTIIVYWTALPFVLGAGGAVLGRIGEYRGEKRAGTDDVQQRDETQDQKDAPTPGQRASQGWAATLMGGLAFGVCFLLFLVEIATG
jgi:hypothetical protein